jgi:hypothetical protein
VEPKETSITRQRLGKHVSAATNTQVAIEESLETVFSVESAPRLYSGEPRSAEGRFRVTYCPLLPCQKVREVSNHQDIGGKHNETSVKFHPSVRRHIPEDGKFRV